MAQNVVYLGLSIILSYLMELLSSTLSLFVFGQIYTTLMDRSQSPAIIEDVFNSPYTSAFTLHILCSSVRSHMLTVRQPWIFIIYSHTLHLFMPYNSPGFVVSYPIQNSVFQALQLLCIFKDNFFLFLKFIYLL